MSESEKIRLSGEYWKQVINVQMHFNDLCIRTRWLLLTVVSTIIAASFLAFKESSLSFDAIVGGVSLKLNLSVFLIIFAIGVCIVLRWLDKKYYFRLLLASVDYGELFERENANIKFAYGEIGGLTDYISGRITRKESKRAASIFYYSAFIALAFILVSMLAVLNKDKFFS